MEINKWTLTSSNQRITDREQIEKHLTKKLGQPTSEVNQNLLAEIVKKINSYYAEPEEQNFTTYSLVGQVSEIVQRRWKEGPKKGQIYYDLILSGTRERLKAKPTNLTPEQFQQVEKLELLGKNLVFQYKKWITNKEVLDFYPVRKEK